MSPVQWQALGNCVGSETRKFYPERGESSRVARETCVGCPVRAACLEHALEYPELFGIWGGLSGRERRRVRRLRVSAAA